MRAEPADGAVLAQAPATLNLTFNEPVAPLVLRLIGPAGEAIPLADAAAENTRITIPLPQSLKRGTHVLSWRVTSADGHPVGGALIFSIGAPSAPPAAGLVADSSVAAALWSARLLTYAGLFLGVGGAFFRAWIATPDSAAAAWPSGILIGLLAAGLIAAAGSVGVQGLDALDLALSELQRGTAWTTGLRTSYGSTAITAAFACIFGLLSLAASPRSALPRLCSLLAVLGVGLALVLSGHAATAAPRPLTVPSVFIHGLCAAFWIGALLPLLAAVGRADARSLARFSRLITAPLILLLVTGSVLAVVQLARLDALWSTSYGIVLVCKLVVVIALLAVAAGNRYLLVPRMQSGGAAAARPLVISVGCELALAVVILGLVACWRFTPPPRSQVATAPISIHLHGDRAMAQIEVAADTMQGAHARISVLDGEFRPLAAKEVTLVLSSASAGIEPLRRAGVALGDGAWRIDDLRLPVAGQWLLRVEILIDDFDKAVLEETVTLPRIP